MTDVKRWPTGDELAAMSVAERSQYVREHTAVAIAALPTAKRLLLEASPLPWEYREEASKKHDAAAIVAAGGSLVISAYNYHCCDFPMDFDGRPEDIALIVHAVNHLPDYEAAVDALEQIRTQEGNVCDQYEICEHVACQSSYGAWAIADAALRRLLPEMPA